MASFLVNSFVSDMAAGNIQPASHTFRMMLTTSSYTPDKDHAKRSSVTNEVSGTGYTAKGEIVTVSVTADNTGDRTVVAVSEPSWSTASFTARYGVVYRDRGGASSADELVGVLDFGADITATGGTFATDESAPFYINH